MTGRVFVVGCSRSGTTVVQRCLAGHPAVTSFPETGFFCKAFGGRHGRLRARLGRIRADRRRRAFERLAETLAWPELAAAGSRLRRPREAIAGCVEALDSIARGRGAAAWVEKTPKHFRYVDLIERGVSDAGLVHVVRDGRDVVASIVDRARRHPGFEAERDPRFAVNLWNEATRTALRCQRRSGHTVLVYETLLERPVAELARVCERLGLEFRESMLDPSGASGIVAADEHWKADVHRPLQAQPSKFTSVLSEAEQAQVLAGLDWSSYRRLLARVAS